MDTVTNYFDTLYKRHKQHLRDDKRIISAHNIKLVHKAMLSVDQDCIINQSTKTWLEKCGYLYYFTFANSGNQNKQSIPKAEICK